MPPQMQSPWLAQDPPGQPSPQIPGWVNPAFRPGAVEPARKVPKQGSAYKDLLNRLLAVPPGGGPPAAAVPAGSPQVPTAQTTARFADPTAGLPPPESTPLVPPPGQVKVVKPAPHGNPAQPRDDHSDDNWERDYPDVPSLVPRGTQVEKDQHSAANQTGQSGAMVGPPRDSAWLSFDRAAQSSPGQAGVPPGPAKQAMGAGQESTPASPLNAMGSPTHGGSSEMSTPPPGAAAGFGPMAAAGAGMRNMIGGLMPELGNPNHLDENGALPKIDMMSGASKSSEASGKMQQTADTHSTLALPDAAFAQAMARLPGGLSGFKMQEDDLKKTRAGAGTLLDREMGMTPFQHMDLSPLFNAFNSLTTTGQQHPMGYTPPQSNIPMLMNIGKTLTEGEGKLGENQLNFLKSQWPDFTNSGLLQVLEGNRKVGAGANPAAALGLMNMKMHQQEQAYTQNRDNAKDASTARAEGGPAENEMLGAFKGINDMAKQYKAGHGGNLPGYVDLGRIGLDKYKLPAGAWSMLHPGKDSAQARDDAQALDRYIGAIQNAATHESYGSRQTAVEIGNKARELGTAASKGEVQMLKGLRDLQTAMKRGLDQKVQMLDNTPALDGGPSARQRYLDGGGLTSDQLNFDFDLGDGKPAPAAAKGSGNESAGTSGQAPAKKGGINIEVGNAKELNQKAEAKRAAAGYPKVVRKGGKQATVSDAQEEAEAKAEGFK